MLSGKFVLQTQKSSKCEDSTAHNVTENPTDPCFNVSTTRGKKQKTTRRHRLHSELQRLCGVDLSSQVKYRHPTNRQQLNSSFQPRNLQIILGDISLHHKHEMLCHTLLKPHSLYQFPVFMISCR